MVDELRTALAAAQADTDGDISAVQQQLHAQRALMDNLLHKCLLFGEMMQSNAAQARRQAV